jgi:hypothetical protein
MKNIAIRTLAKVTLIFFLYILTYYFYIGLTGKPTEGDSLAYHIPIAKSIADGSFIHPHYTFDHDYFPGSFESILAVFMILHIPLNLYNVLAIILLFFATRSLAVLFGLSNDFAIVFAVSICTLNVVVRWATAQTVDIWLGVFYVFALTLLLNPQHTLRYFFKLGLAFGMLVGTKYSGVLYVCALLAVYLKNVVQYVTLKRLIVFSLPVIILGLFWYVRNYFAINNPFYPLDMPFFKGLKGNPIIQIQVWKTIVQYPGSMFNAFLGEYMVWSISIIAVPLLCMYHVLTKQTGKLKPMTQLLIVSLVNLLIFLLLPADSSYQSHVSNLRYAYPLFIPLLLSVFLFAKEYHKEEAIALVSIANMITLPSLQYHPKLLVLYVPLVFVVLYPTALLRIKSFFKIGTPA